MTPPATRVTFSPLRPAHHTIRVTDAPGMHRCRKRLFVAVARNAASPVDFRLPHERPITMGWQVPL